MPLENPNLLTELLAHSEAWFGQLVAIALAALLGWWFDALFLRNLSSTQKAQDKALKAAKRITFPVFMLGGVLLARAILAHYGASVSLLKLAIPLLLSLVFIRLLVYVVRNVFPYAARLKSWERTIAVTAWLVVALHVTGLLEVVLLEMERMSFSLGHQSISLLAILQGLVSIAATLLAALWLGNFVEVRIMRMEEMDSSSRVLMSKLVRGALLVISVLIALALAGIDVRVLSVFGGALGVGLGFGLQRVFSNYIGGFIILLDKSIRLGDVVTLDNRYGTVTRLTGRYMVLTGHDGAEFLIPNELAITQALVNHSYTDRNVRIKLRLQVAYRTDLEQAMQLMLDVAHGNASVNREPAPSVHLVEFADNGIALELLVWVADSDITQTSLRSELNLGIWRAFRQAGIEIPYPQREVRLINAS